MSMINTNFLQTGDSWSQISNLGFNFATTTPSHWFLNATFIANYETGLSGVEFSGFSNASSFDQKDTIRYLLLDDVELNSLSGNDTVNTTLLNSWDFRVSFSDVINADISETTSGEIQLINHQAKTSSDLSLANTPDGILGSEGDVVMNYIDSGLSDLAPGEYGFWLHLHELGHAVGGLEDVANTAEAGGQYDTMKYTMMSYNSWQGVYASGLQLLDIAALQDTYGTRNYSTRSSDTTYSLGNGLGYDGASEADGFLYTIWDGNGVDEIDASSFTATSATIDLRQGKFSTIGVTQENVGIAYHSIIENATGTQNNDTLIGNAWDNVLNGGAGNDNIYGDGVVYDGNAGFGTNVGEHDVNNPESAASSNDSGDDKLYGGAGNDNLYGGAGNDILNPGTGINYIDGGAGDDIVDYTFATVVVDVDLSTGTDSLGNTLINIEKIIPSALGGTQTGTSGADTLLSGVGDDILDGGAWSDTYEIAAGGGHDQITDTDEDSDVIFGSGLFWNPNSVTESNNGVLITFSAAQSLELHAYSTRWDGYSLQYDDGEDVTVRFAESSGSTISFSGNNTNVYYNNYVLVGDIGDDTLISNAQDDILFGGAGDDYLQGYTGNDILYGGLGNDTVESVVQKPGEVTYLYGEAGDDSLKVAVSAQTYSTYTAYLDGGSGNDDYFIQKPASDESISTINSYLTDVSGDDSYLMFRDNAYVTDLDGDDYYKLTRSWGTGAVDIEAHISDTNGYDKFEFILFANEANLLTHTMIGDDLELSFDRSLFVVEDYYLDDVYKIEEAKFLDTGYFDFELLLSQDTVFGTNNSDTSLTGDAADNVIWGFAGDDNISTGLGDDTLNGGDGNDTLDGGDGVDTVDYSDAVAGVNVNIQSGTATDGNGDTDTLLNIENIIGSDFDDVLVGNNALENSIWGGAGNDNIQGRAQGDNLYGEAGSDELRGADGEDILYGGDDNDFLYGHDGNDTLYGGDGLDAIWGHSGADTFVLEAASAYNQRDNIKDFSTSDGDKLDISDLLSLYDPLNDAITDFVQITDNGTHSYVAVDADGGANNFQQVVQLSSITGLTDEQALETNGTLITV